MTQHTDNKDLRSFGLVVGGVFAGIGLWPVLVHQVAPRWWALLVGGALLLLGGVRPQLLTPIHRLWMMVGHALGWVNTRILLGLIFYGLITPMGLLMRLFGNDAMRRALVQDVETYRVPRQPRPPAHLRRQF